MPVDRSDEREETIEPSAQIEFNGLLHPFQPTTESANFSGSMEASHDVNEDTEEYNDETEFLMTQEFQQTCNEYNWRSIRGQTDPGIHHWNWLGKPVYERSSTPPADSLAFMQAEPKAPVGSDKHRINAVMNNAIELNDPVIVKAGSGNEDMFKMHGSQLVRTCENQVSTFYTVHGRWMKEIHGHAITPDIGQCLDLENAGYTVGNGIFGHRLINRNDWHEWKREIQAAKHKCSGRSRKMRWKRPPPSGLRHFKVIDMQVIEDGEVPAPSEGDQASGDSQSLDTGVPNCDIPPLIVTKTWSMKPLLFFTVRIASEILLRL